MQPLTTAYSFPFRYGDSNGVAQIMNFVNLEKGVGLLCCNFNYQMATSFVSLSLRATPRSRVDTPCAVVLPKIQVASTDVSATQSRAPGDQLGLHKPVEDKSRSTDSPVKECSLTQKEALVYTAATIREMELEIEPNSKNGHSNNLQDTARFGGGITGNINLPRSRTRSDRSPEAKASKPSERDQRTFTHPERPRTVTWPSLQYKVWVDSSNLSFHRLNATNRPVSQIRSSRQCERNFTKQQVIALSRGKRIGSGRASLLTEDTEFVIGSPEKWHVSLSHVNKVSTGGASNAQRRILDPTKRSDMPTTGVNFPRLPSRMGRNSLDCFLDNSEGDALSNLQVRPRLKSQVGKNRLALDADTSVDSSLRDSRTSALKLRGIVRNPAMHTGQHAQEQKVKKVTISIRPGSRNEPSSSKIVQNKGKTGAKKHLSFKIPFSSSDWEVHGKETEGIKEEQKWIRGGRKGIIDSDIASHHAAPVLHLEDTYHITKYISTK